MNEQTRKFLITVKEEFKKIHHTLLAFDFD